MQLHNSNQGFSLVEALLAVAIFSLGISAFVGSIIYGSQSTALAGTRARAVLYAEEGLEAVRNIRDPDFINLVDGTYGLSTAGNLWSLSGSSNTQDVFTRQVKIETVDTNRKFITSTVTWQQNPQRTGSVVLNTYLTNWIKSMGNWSPPVIDSSFDLSAGNSGEANANGISLTLRGNFAYLGRTNGGGREFYIFDISNPTSPQLVGQRDLNGNPNDIVIVDNFAYIASSDNNSELQIVDISNPATIQDASKLTVVNLDNGNSGSNNDDAIALAVTSNYLIMARAAGDEILIFDITNRATPGNPVGRTGTLTGTVTDVVAYSNDHVYATTTDNAAELQGFTITNKSSPARSSIFNLNSGNDAADALALTVAGSQVLVGRASSAGTELYSVSVSNPTSPALSSTIELGASVLAITYDSILGYAFLATSDAANDVKIIDASNPAALPAPPPFGLLNIADSSTDIAYSTDLNRLLFSNSNDSQELIILKGQ